MQKLFTKRKSSCKRNLERTKKILILAFAAFAAFAAFGNSILEILKKQTCENTSKKDSRKGSRTPSGTLCYMRVCETVCIKEL